MMYATFIAPQVIATIIGSHPEGVGGNVLCKSLTAGILAWVGGISSMVTLVVIAFERYFAVMYPHNREIKFDVTWSYVKRQTAKMKLLPSVFSSLNSRVKIFVFVANSRNISLFLCDLMKD